MTSIEKLAMELYPIDAIEIDTNFVIDVGKLKRDVWIKGYQAGATSENEEVKRFAEWTSTEEYYYKNGFWYYPASSIRFTTADLFKQFKKGK